MDKIKTTRSTLEWMMNDFKKDLVSVVIPTYNRSNYLLDALESVWLQTYRPIEIIVVNDGSTDNTSEKIREWKLSHPNNSTFSTKEIIQNNNGVSSARNKGLTKSTGEYVQFLDSDDLLDKEKFQKSVNEFKSDPELDLVFTKWILSVKGKEDRIIAGPRLLGNNPSVYKTVLHYLWTASPLYRRTIIAKSGPWNENLTRSEDREFCARVMFFSKKIKKIEYPGAIYRQFIDPVNITSSFSLPNPIHVKSGWIANKKMSELIHKENHPNKSIALKKLAKINLHYAKRSIPCKLSYLSREIIINDKYIWKLSINNRIKAIFILFISLLPTNYTSYISQKIILIKLKISH